MEPPTAGKWYIETDKKVRLFCVETDSTSIGLSYGPGSPIAVRVTRGDFPIFFHEAPPDVRKALRNLLDVIGAAPERNDAGDVTAEQYQRLGRAVEEAEAALAADP